MYLSCFLSPPSNVTRLYFFENQDHNIAVIDQSKNVLLIPKLQAQKKCLFVHYMYGNGVFIIYRKYCKNCAICKKYKANPSAISQFAGTFPGVEQSSVAAQFARMYFCI